LLRRRSLPPQRLFLWVVVAAAPLSVLAMEAGWMVTEIGRQPWVVQGYMRTHEAVTGAPGIPFTLLAILAIYALLTAGTVLALRTLAARPLAGEADAA